jgi:hypothetical protein
MALAVPTIRSIKQIDGRELVEALDPYGGLHLGHRVLDVGHGSPCRPKHVFDA